MSLVGDLIEAIAGQGFEVSAKIRRRWLWSAELDTSSASTTSRDSSMSNVGRVSLKVALTTPPPFSRSATTGGAGRLP
jgi:hypothetical protein